MTAPHPLDRYAGSWALVTGSAREMGLGFAFAQQLGARGINIALVDILADDLEMRAAELRATYSVEVRPIAADLADLSAYPRIVEALSDVHVDVLICDHMYTPKETPKILDMSLDMHNAMIDINARAYVNLIHRFGNMMTSRGKGAIVIVSSGGGLIPAPYTGAYAANKGFQIIFGEALWYETRNTGVDVLVMVAGLMDTQGEALARYPKWQLADPNDAAAQTLRQIGHRHMVIPGRANRLVNVLNTRVLTRRRAIKQMGAFMESGLGK